MAMVELHPVKMPEALLAELNSAAASQHKSVDEIVQEALRAHFRERAWDEMIGEARARTESLEIREEDVEQTIAESRRIFAQ